MGPTPIHFPSLAPTAALILSLALALALALATATGLAIGRQPDPWLANEASYLASGAHEPNAATLNPKTHSLPVPLPVKSHQVLNRAPI